MSKLGEAIKSQLQNRKEEDKKEVISFISEYKCFFVSQIDIFEEYRKYFKDYKENKLIYQTEEYKIEKRKKEQEFSASSKKFNTEVEKLSKSLSTELFIDEEFSKLQLELLTYLQLAQIKNTRVHTRLNKMNIELALERIEIEKTRLKEISDKNQEIENGLKFYNTSIISIMGIFVCIFSLISININFFQTKEVGNIKNIIALFLIINSTALISLTALFRFIYKFLYKSIEKEEVTAETFFKYYFIPLIIFLIAIGLIG
ncbi:hypothetical protein [Fusobacterium varium]